MLAGIISALKTIAVKEKHYGQHNGAMLFAKGMDYHYQNYLINYRSENYEWHHEVVAYLNRAGQMYYYLISENIGANKRDMPCLFGASRFRMKYSAHRQIDAPRPGDYMADYAAPGITSIKPARKFQAFEHRSGKDYFPGITIPIGTDECFDSRSFYLNDEHLYIMADVLRVLSLVATNNSSK